MTGGVATKKRTVAPTDGRFKRRTRLLAKLTPREREVLVLYVEQPFAETLARKLGTRPQTVRNQLASMLRKLKMESREELIVRFLSAKR